MSVRKFTEFKCDFCGGNPQKTDAEVGPPLGWIEVRYNHPHEDRTRIDRHLCPDCIKRVTEAVKRATL